MSTLKTESTHHAASPDAPANGPPQDVPASGPPQEATIGAEPSSRWRSPGTIFLFLLIGALAAAGIYTWRVGLEKARQDLDHALAYVRQHNPSSPGSSGHAKTVEATPTPPWDGFVRISLDDAKTIGLLVVTVQPQVEPIKLPVMGRTDYDPNTLSKIRPRFDTLVEKVRAERGQPIKKGDPLVDLFSTELAAAKNDFQTAYVQWQHDKRLLKMRQRLFEEKAASEQVVIDALNDENKSSLTAATAKEKLIVFGVPEEQIDLLVKYSADQSKAGEIHTISDKARMTRLSPVDGIVIQRDAVPGNLYDNNDVLMTIAPLDHLFVWVNVYEADQAKVVVGQDMEIHFPYMDRTILAKVEYVASEVSKDTRAIMLRASIPNVDGKLKADMLVRAFLRIPPVAGQTVIPRQAMVVMNGSEYAFIQKEPGGGKAVEQFERRRLVVAEERDDHVVVQSGLAPSDHVASNGSLVLAQLYEDQQMVATGMPLK